MAITRRKERPAGAPADSFRSGSREALRTLAPALAPMPSSDVADRKFVTALGRGFDVLRAFQLRAGSLSNKEIAELTGIPKPTVSRLTHTLGRLGYLRQRDADGRYELSLAILSLGYPLLSGSRVRHVAHDFMTRLAAAHDCTVMLAAREGLAMVIVDERSGPSATTMRVDVGARIEIARSAVGRAYISGCSDEERGELLAQLKRYHGQEWAELEPRVHAAIDDSRRRGFCLVEGEWLRDTRSVAAPLVNRDTVMVLGCGAPLFAVSHDVFESQIGPHLVHVATALSKFIDP